MFQILIEPIQQSCDELGRMFRIIDECQNKTESAIRVLESMHGFEDIIPACRRQRNAIRDEGDLLRRETKVLGDALINYRQYENRMLQNGEEGLVRNQILTSSFIDLKSSAVSQWNIKLV